MWRAEWGGTEETEAGRDRQVSKVQQYQQRCRIGGPMRNHILRRGPVPRLRAKATSWTALSVYFIPLMPNSLEGACVCSVADDGFGRDAGSAVGSVEGMRCTIPAAKCAVVAKAVGWAQRSGDEGRGFLVQRHSPRPALAYVGGDAIAVGDGRNLCGRLTGDGAVTATPQVLEVPISPPR